MKFILYLVFVIITYIWFADALLGFPFDMPR